MNELSHNATQQTLINDKLNTRISKAVFLLLVPCSVIFLLQIFGPC